MRVFKYILLFSLFYIVNNFLFYGCADKINYPDDEISASVNSCEGCHTNYDHLKEVFSPDTIVESAGCGGDAPHYEPYDRVYMGGENYEEFASSTHGKLACTSCHNGVDNSANKNEAHSGDFIKHPSDYPEKYCSCHSTEVGIGRHQ